MRALSYIILGLALALVGCDAPFYSKSYSFTNDTWKYDDPRSFSFEIEDTTKMYDMILKIDHTDQFPYQNLYVKTTTTFPSDSITNQSLSLEMSNEAGFWFGECKGSNCALSIPIQSKIRFMQSGQYNLSLEQYTRTDTLRGMRSIELRILEL